jgi:hypothetical protein
MREEEREAFRINRLLSKDIVPVQVGTPLPLLSSIKFIAEFQFQISITIPKFSQIHILLHPNNFQASHMPVLLHA